MVLCINNSFLIFWGQMVWYIIFQMVMMMMRNVEITHTHTHIRFMGIQRIQNIICHYTTIRRNTWDLGSTLLVPVDL